VEFEAASPSLKKSKEFKTNHTIYGELISQMILKCSGLFFTLYRNASTFVESRRYFTIEDKYGNW